MTTLISKTQGDYLPMDDDIVLAHRYRLKLEPPPQSAFRVVALLFYELLPGSPPDSSDLPMFLPAMTRKTADGRTYVVGTNDEPGYMGGAICAERAAMVQLRFAPPFRITKVVIATDSREPISPGMLCREFLAGHTSVPWNLPIVSSGNCCHRCAVKDKDLFESSSLCSSDYENHDIHILKASLGALYPFPSPYTRLNARESVSAGSSYAMRKTDSPAEAEGSIFDSLDPKATATAALAIDEAKSTVDNNDNHPIQFGAAVLFQDGTSCVAHQTSALEYGCSLDAVSQLAPSIISQTAKQNPPKWIVQADQYGVLHAPFAPARAFLTENSFQDCFLLVHSVDQSDEDPITTGISDHDLKQVRAGDLAPNAPSWTDTTERTSP